MYFFLVWSERVIGSKLKSSHVASYRLNFIFPYPPPTPPEKPHIANICLLWIQCWVRWYSTHQDSLQPWAKSTSRISCSRMNRYPPIMPTYIQAAKYRRGAGIQVIAGAGTRNVRNTTLIVWCSQRVQRHKNMVKHRRGTEQVNTKGGTRNVHYLAFTKGRPSIKMQRKPFHPLEGRDGDWLDLFVWPVQDILESVHEVLAIVIAEESRMFSYVLPLPQWYCCHNFDHSYHIYKCTRDHGELFWSSFGWDDFHPYAHTEAKYTGIMLVLFRNITFIDGQEFCVDSITLWHRREADIQGGRKTSGPGSSKPD